MYGVKETIGVITVGVKLSNDFDNFIRAEGYKGNRIVKQNKNVYFINNKGEKYSFISYDRDSLRGYRFDKIFVSNTLYFLKTNKLRDLFTPYDMNNSIKYY